MKEFKFNLIALAAGCCAAVIVNIFLLYIPAPVLASADSNILKTTIDPKTHIETVELKEPDRFGMKVIRTMILENDNEGNVKAFPGFEKQCDRVRLYSLKSGKAAGRAVCFSDYMTDGRLEISFYPNLILLTTRHHCENPDSLEWYQFINKEQYAALLKVLELYENKKDVFTFLRKENGSTEYWMNPFYKHFQMIMPKKEETGGTDLYGHVQNDDRENYKYMSFVGFISLANSLISGAKKHIPLPDYYEMCGFKTLLMSTDGILMSGKSAEVEASVEKSINRPDGKVTFNIDNQTNGPVFYELEVKPLSKGVKTPYKLELGDNMLAAGTSKTAEADLKEQLKENFCRGLYSFKGIYTGARHGETKEIRAWPHYFRCGMLEDRKMIFKAGDKYDMLMQLYFSIKQKQFAKPGVVLNEAERTIVDVWEINWAWNLQLNSLWPMCSYMEGRPAEILDCFKKINARGMAGYADKMKKLFPDGIISEKWCKKYNEDNPNEEFPDYYTYRLKHCRGEPIDRLYDYAVKHEKELIDAQGVDLENNKPGQ